MRVWIMVLALACCIGCPTADEPKHMATLNLDTTEVPRPLRVGDTTNLNLTLKRGEVGELFSAGAFLADDSNQRLTKWHVSPEGSVRIDPETKELTFEAAGDVQVWASWADADGTPLRSNTLSFTVSAK